MKICLILWTLIGFPLMAATEKMMKTQTAYLAGGCFWGMEELIRQQPGVISTDVGYTGGQSNAKTYELVKTGTTGQAEAIKVIFNPLKISYGSLLEFFFRIHDPTTINQQGNDKGTQYRSAIFFVDSEQEKVARQIKEKIDISGKWKSPIVTEITKFKEFSYAEEYHQDYLKKNPGGYTCHWVRN